MIERDPRMQPGAYITDGIDLYEVTGTQRGPGVMGISTVRISVENCRNLRQLEFLPDQQGDIARRRRHEFADRRLIRCAMSVAGTHWRTSRRPTVRRYRHRILLLCGHEPPARS